MKRLFLGLAAAMGLVVASATESTAQAKPEVMFGFAAGPSIPFSDFGDSFGAGFHGGASVTILPVSMTNLSFRFEGAYSKFTSKDDVFASPVDMRVINGAGNVVLGGRKASGASPFAIAGLGFYNMREDLSTGGSETKFGFGGGVGVKFPLSGFDGVIEARVVRVQTDLRASMWMPISVSLLF